MNVSCPECRSVFRVDPAKLPPMAVRARCSVCGGVITVAAGAPTDDEFSSNSAASTASARAVSSAERPVTARTNQGLAAALADTFAPPPSAPRSPTPASSAGAVPPPERHAPVAEAAPTVVKQAGLPPTPKGPAPVAGGVNRPVLFPPRPMMPGAAPQGGAAAARPIVAPRPAAAPSTSSAASSAASAPRQSGGFAAPSSTAPTAGAVSVASPPASAAAASPPVAPRPAPAPAVAAGAPAATRTPINPFLANDPHAKAKRLARALVSDLVTYFPQKRQDGLRDGTLKQLFKDEIQKSYEEYVAQVGRDFAETTSHFQDALNDLLAGGQKVF